jgi:hypothetical protein
MRLDDFIQVSGVWILPFGLAAFVFGLMLLMIGSLPEPARRWLLPSLAIYLVGLANIIFWKELAHRRHLETWTEGETRNLPTRKLQWFVAAHVVWFLTLLGYNVAKGVL